MGKEQQCTFISHRDVMVIAAKNYTYKTRAVLIIVAQVIACLK